MAAFAHRSLRCSRLSASFVCGFQRHLHHRPTCRPTSPISGSGHGGGAATPSIGLFNVRRSVAGGRSVRAIENPHLALRSLRPALGRHRRLPAGLVSAPRRHVFTPTDGSPVVSTCRSIGPRRRVFVAALLGELFGVYLSCRTRWASFLALARACARSTTPIRDLRGCGAIGVALGSSRRWSNWPIRDAPAPRLAAGRRPPPDPTVPSSDGAAEQRSGGEAAIGDIWRAI